MKILVTGHKGFIGKNFIEKYLDIHTLHGWEWNPNMLPEVQGFDWVIHLGAISSTTENDVDKIILQNYEFSKWLFNECNKNNVNLQYASSASVYGNTTHFTEDKPLNPQSPYAWSKYLFDRWVSKQERKIHVQGLRFFNVYGKHEDHKADQMSVFHKFRHQAKTKSIIEPFENSNQIYRDFVCVDDVIEIMHKFLFIKSSGIWNVGTGTATSFGEIAQIISEQENAKISEIPLPENLKTQYQSFTQSNNKKLLDTIGNFKFITPREFLLR